MDLKGGVACRMVADTLRESALRKLLFNRIFDSRL